MKRYLCSLFCLAIILILLSGCGSSNNGHSNGHSTEGADFEPTKYETVNNLEGVTMSVKEETVSSTGLTVLFENKTDKQCIYGEYFSLEKQIEGKWYQVPVAFEGNYGFNDIGYNLESSDVSEWEVDWEWLYGHLDTGDYRIVKDILDFRDTGDFDKYYLSAEFNID